VRKGRPHLWIALFSAAAVGLVAVVNLGRTSPGPLARVHSRMDDLNDRWSCSECHGGWGASMQSACLDCHEEVAAHIQSGAGLHGALDATVREACASCHSDHHGEGFGLVNAQSFALAGVDDLEGFEHARVGFPMDGRHLDLACTECHEFAQTRFLPEEEQRYMGLDRRCVSCHDDPHAGALGESCTQCHGQTAFDQLASLGHEEFLPLEGAHAALDCRTCHAQDETHALESLASAAGASAARECVSCHPSPHALPFMDAVAAKVSGEVGGACAACHLAAHEEFEQGSVSMDTALHALAGFPLDSPHAGLDCTECHAEGVAFAERYPGRERDLCAHCHEDPHDGQFDEGSFGNPTGSGVSGSNCVACHEREHFEPHAFGALEHERTLMALTGSHLEARCEACHERPTESKARRFRGTSSRREDCHQDAHRGAFDGLISELAQELASVEQGRCARCHLTGAFSDVTESEFPHGRWTGFEVDGAHAQEACESCHPRSHERGPDGRSFGFVSEHFGDFTGCSTCHEDPHQGMFGATGMPAVVGQMWRRCWYIPKAA
jgi:hypothetical protein